MDEDIIKDLVEKASSITYDAFEDFTHHDYEPETNQALNQLVGDLSRALRLVGQAQDVYNGE